jgi:hypothetical protein
VKGPVLALAVALWAALLGAGGWLLWRYATTPGAPATAPRSWPKEATSRRAADRATVVMVAHPRCPCTRASLTELSELMGSLAERAEALVLFVQPEGEQEQWSHTDLFRQAQAVPRARVVVDIGGREAERFGAKTSGQTLVYDAHGDLLFAGGITAFRGHPGDSAGLSRVRALVETGHADKGTSLVFGCPLADDR